MSESSQAIGFAPEEIDPTTSTRAARLKWVVVVDETLPAGRAVNAAVCTAAATTARVTGLLAEDAIDADGQPHPAIPWIGCSILAANPETLRRIRDKAASSPACFVADMPTIAQQIRVYADYLESMKEIRGEDMEYLAVSIVGPRNRVDKIVGRLPLLP
ncbi:DUF2000 domain-containing protein [Nocardia sp. NPDC003482]|uniref:DUF2000 domain-containing protein n=1 Tax=Nocardia sp. NPDC004068 TaxID=3364303 RepID=UPI0036AB88C2